jgi:hypothetical protein
MDLDRSLRAALALLTSLKPRITHILAGEPLRVDLNSLDIMGNDVHNAHVLWLGPTPASDDARRLRAVCGAYTDTLTHSPQARPFHRQISFMIHSKTRGLSATIVLSRCIPRSLVRTP